MIEKVPGYTYLRATTPHGNLGMLEVVVRSRSQAPSGVPFGRHPEIEVSDYGNIGRRALDSQDVFHRDRHETGRYTVYQLPNWPDPDRAWVVSCADGAVAACPMETTPSPVGYMGERAEAERWAAHLNYLFDVEPESSAP